MTLTQLLVLLIAVNALLAGPFMVVARRQFATQGRWSPAVASWSGLVMHGQAVLTIGLGWVDRGSWYAPSGASIATGAALFAAGAGVIAAGRWAYGSQKRVYGLLEDELIVAGIYRWSRNPQYVGYALAFLGGSLASGSAWALGSTLLFAGIVHVFITRVEEPHLEASFGEPYASYRAQTRRYL